jgi:hypothetical protein
MSIDPKELRDASIALCDWFTSQDIGPSDAILVCGWATAAILVTYAKERSDLQRGQELYQKAFHESCELHWLGKEP